MNIRLVLFTPNDIQGTIKRLNKAVQEVFRESVPSITQVQTGSYSQVALVSEKEVSKEDAQRIYDYYVPQSGLLADKVNPFVSAREIPWPDPLGPIRLPADQGEKEY
jgi:hypothetical protein